MNALRSRPILLVLGVGAVCLVAIAVLAVVGILRGSPPPPAPSVYVAIRIPRQGASLSLDRAQRVMVEAHGSDAIQRQELWVDGRLAAVRSSDEPAAAVQFLWRPEAPGPHTLVARAFDPLGRAGRSKPVVIVVEEATEPVWLTANLAEGETLESLSVASGVSVEALRDANPGMPDSLPADSEVVIPFPGGPPEGFVPADPPRAPDGEFQPAVPAPGFPSPIDLSVESTGSCGVHLRWTGGDGARSFRLLRFGVGDPDFVVIHELPGDRRDVQTQVPIAGEFLFLVEAANEVGATESDLARIEVPDECESFPVPPDDPAGQPWQFEGLELITPDSFERLYCYVGVGGARYQRLPEGDDDFLVSPDGRVWDLLREAGGIQRLVFRWQPETPTPVRFECWGWQGDDLRRLGDAEWIPDGSPGVRDLIAPGFKIQGAQGPLDGLTRLVPVSHEDPSIPPPFDPRLSPAGITCENHISWTSGSEREPGERRFLAWACREPSVDLLQWEWQANLDTERDDLSGFRVFLNRDYGTDPREDDHTLQTWEVLGEIGSAIQLYPIPRPACEQTFGFKAQAFVAEFRLEADRAFGERPEFRPVDVERASAPSETYTLTGGPCPTPSVLVEIRLDELVVEDTVDECFDIDFQCDDDDLEGYGNGIWYRVDAEEQAHEVASMTFWNERSGCVGGFGHACLPSQDEGRVRAHDRLLLAMEPIDLCLPGEGCTGFGRDHHRFQVWVEDGDAVSFDFALWDYDGVSGDDIWCGTTDDPAFWVATVDGPVIRTRAFRIGPFDWETWAGFNQRQGSWNNSEFPGQRDHAECAFHITVTAVEVEEP